jgi:hypothetical protein
LPRTNALAYVFAATVAKRGYERASTLGATSLSHKTDLGVKSLAMGKHTILVVHGIGIEEKSFKIFARGFERASTLADISQGTCSFKYYTRMKSNAADKHSSLFVSGIGGQKKSFKRFARGFVKKRNCTES